MRKTHKKILGFAGLGLVAATTTVAAMLPSYPSAYAVAGSTTDVVQVTVVTGNPDLAATSASESEITTPEYSFSVTYNRLVSAKATLTNYDEDGNVIFTQEIWNEALDKFPGSKDFNLNLDEYGGKGYFVITVKGTGDDGVELEQILSVAYVSDAEESDADPDSGKAVIDAEVPYEEVEKVVITVTDEDGNVVKTIEITDPDDIENVDLSDLPDGPYEIKIDSYNEYGDLIGTDTMAVTKTGDHFIIEIPIRGEIDTVVAIETDLYNEAGNIARKLRLNRFTGVMSVYSTDGELLFTLDNAYSDGKMTIPMEGLPYGTYKSVTVFKNQYNRLVGGTIKATIRYYGKAIIVPDTGSFLQGLNISREDYLITGLIVFMVIGVVAFGVVKRNRGVNKTKVNGKNRR